MHTSVYFTLFAVCIVISIDIIFNLLANKIIKIQVDIAIVLEPHKQANEILWYGNYNNKTSWNLTNIMISQRMRLISTPTPGFKPNTACTRVLRKTVTVGITSSSLTPYVTQTQRGEKIFLNFELDSKLFLFQLCGDQYEPQGGGLACRSQDSGEV